MNILRLLAVMWGLWLSTLSPAAFAQDLITQRAWLEDPSGQLQWPQVLQLQPQPYEGVLSKGFGTSPLWVRLRIAGITPTPGLEQDNLVLRIRPVYLDDIQVFDPQAPNGRAGVTGDTHHPQGSRLQGMDFLVHLTATPQARDIWLRVTSTSTRQISTSVVREHDLLNLTQREHLLFALYVGLVSIFSLWGITYWFFTKETVAGLFGIKQLAALTYALCVLGYMRIFWPPTWSAHALDLLSSFFSMFATSAGIYFHLKFLSEFKPRAWSLWVLRLLAGMLIVNLMLFFVFDMPRLALQLNLSTVFIAPVALLISVLFARGWKQTTPEQPPVLPRYIVVSFYTLLLVMLAAASLPGLGLIKGGEITIYLVQAHGLASGFLVLLMLQYRANVIQKQQLQAQQQLERMNIQYEQDQLARQEQEQLLTMLTHELKTPLATMSMRLDANTQSGQDIKRAIREMNGIIERCLQSSQLGDLGLQVHIDRIDLVSTLRDVVTASPAPHRIELTHPPHWHIHSDAQLIFIVLSNLLENACKYAAPDTPITVELQQPSETGAHVGLMISNTVGKSGWPDKDKLFNKYYRTPGAQRQAGTGLGLFLVRNLMHKLGGDIAYAPQGQQVRFVVTFPSNT